MLIERILKKIFQLKEIKFLLTFIKKRLIKKKDIAAKHSNLCSLINKILNKLKKNLKKLKKLM